MREYCPQLDLKGAICAKAAESTSLTEWRMSRSPSFTLLTCGIATLFLSLFYWLIDVKGYNKWGFFFVVVGMNSITIYAAGFIIAWRDLANVIVGRFDFGNANAITIAIVVATIKWFFLFYLYKQKVFLKI